MSENEEVDPQAALETEAVAEQAYPDGVVEVPLGGKTVHVLPPDEWTSLAQQDLTSGRFEDWAQDCLAGDDYENVWAELNDGRGPKLGDIEKMFVAWQEITGQSAGKSRKLRLSSRNGRRR